MKKLLSLLLVMVLAFGIFVAMPTTYAEASVHGAYLGAAVEVHDANGNAVSVQEYRDVDAEKLAEAWSYAHQLLEDPQAVKVVVNIYEDWAAGKNGFGSGDGFENGALLIDDARLFLNLHGTKLTQHENKDYAIIIDGAKLNCLKSSGHHAVISGAVYVENCKIEPYKIAFNNADGVDFVVAEGASVRGALCVGSAAYRAIDTGYPGDDAVVMTVTVGSKVTAYKSFADGWNAAIKAGTATVKLYADWLSNSNYKMGEGDGFSEGRLKVGENKDITLDLNGHTIDRRLESKVEDGQVFRLESNGKLTIIDSNSVLSKGIITGAYSDDDGGAVYMDDSSKLVLRDVILEYNNTYDGGAGVYITGDDSVLIVEGSTVIRFGDCYRGGAICTDDDADVYLRGDASLVGNHASRYYNKEEEEDYGRGGAVYLGGTSALYMSEDAIIRDNSADWRGGGIFAVNDPDIIIDSALDDCSIEYNYAGNYGGAISSPELRLFAWNESTYNIKGGRIVGNTVGWDGGAIHWDGDHGKLILNGVSITCNKSLNNSDYDKNGGGVHIDINADDVLIGGDVFIMYNTVKGFANNLSLYNYGINIKTIEGSPLKDGAKISLYLESGDDDEDYDDQISADSTPFNKGDSRFFIHEAEKDDADMVIVEKDAGNGKVDLYLAHVEQAKNEYAIAEFTDFALDEAVIGSHNVSINKETKEIIVEVNADNYLLLKNVGIASYVATDIVSYKGVTGASEIKAARDYTQPQVFTVTAENKNGYATSDWTVKAVPAGNNGWNKYTVTVEADGKTAAEKDYFPYEEVTVTAPHFYGKAFISWTVTPNTLVVEDTETVTFDMPAEDVTLEAEYMEAVTEVRIEDRLDVVSGQPLASILEGSKLDDNDFGITLIQGSDTLKSDIFSIGFKLFKEDGTPFYQSEAEATLIAFGSEYEYEVTVSINPALEIQFAKEVAVYLDDALLTADDVTVNGNVLKVRGSIKCAEAVFAGVVTDKISLMMGHVSSDEVEEAIYAALPEEVEIKVISENKQMVVDAAIKWGNIESAANSNQHQVIGTVVLPEGVIVPAGTTAANIGNTVQATINVAAKDPVINISAANADGEVTVSLDIPVGSEVRYTTNGTSPLGDDYTVYDGPLVLEAAAGETKTVQISAVAVSVSGNSNVVTKEYTWTHFAEVKVSAEDGEGKAIYGYSSYALTGDGRYVNGQPVAFAAKNFVADGKNYKVEGVTITDGDGNAVTDTEPAVSGYQFYVDGDITIEVSYDVDVIVDSVDVELPVIGAGDALPTTLDVETEGISGTIAWDPAGPAAFGVTYEATVTLVADDDHMFGDFVSINAEGMVEVGAADDKEVVFTFNFSVPKDPVTEVEAFADIVVESGTAEADVLALLPSTADIETASGVEATVGISWICANSGGFDGDVLGTYVFIGTLAVDAAVDAAGKYAEVHVIVSDKAIAPTADLASGTYTGEQEVELATITDGAVIYYTLDGTMPSATNGEEYTDAIELPVVGDGIDYVITAVAVFGGNWDIASDVAVFSYTVKPVRYEITLLNKDIELLSEPIDGGFKAGDIVNLKYNNDDKHLNYWAASGGSFANKWVRETSFTMPADDVSISVNIFDKTNKVSVTVDAPIGDEAFVKRATFTAGSHSGTASITWYKEVGGEWVKIDTANEVAVEGEQYKAVFRVGDNGNLKLVFHEKGKSVVINREACDDCVDSWVRVTNGAQFEHIFTAAPALPELTSQPVLAVSTVKAPTGTTATQLYLPKTMVVETTAGDMVAAIDWEDNYIVQGGKTRVDGRLDINGKISNPDSRYDLSLAIEVEFYDLDPEAPAAPHFAWDEDEAEFVLTTDYSGTEAVVYYELVELDVENDGIIAEADLYDKFAEADVDDSEYSAAIEVAAAEGRRTVYLLTAVAAVEKDDSSFAVSRPAYFAAFYDGRGELIVEGGVGGGVYAEGTEVNIVADEPAEGEQFICWTVEDGDVEIEDIFAEGDETSASAILIMPDTDVTVKANFGKTLINTVELEFDAPVGGDEISREVEYLAVGIDGVVTEIDSSLLSQLVLGWNPAPVNKDGVYYADFNTVYTGGVTLTPYPMEVTYGDNNQYTYTITAKFADEVTATINGEDAIVSKQGESISIYYTFAATDKAELLSINTPAALSVPAGIAAADVIDMLPETVTAIISGGTAQLDVEWDTDNLSFNAAGAVEISGEVVVPDALDNNGVETAITITVNVVAVEQVASPEADPVGGEYKDTELSEVELATETAGAIIYYTTDGSTPSRENGMVYAQPIAVTADTVIKAIAVKEGMLDSTVMTEEYTVLVAHKVTVDGTLLGSYYAGETVTVAAESGTIWSLAGIASVTDNGDDTHSFTMPNNDVIMIGHGVAVDGIDRVDLTMPKLEVGKALSDYQFTCQPASVVMDGFTWNASGVVEADKHYTATVRLVATFAEHGTVYVNGNEVPSFLNDDGSVTVYYSVYTADQQLESIGSINKTLVVANGTLLGEMKLPQTVTVATNKVDALDVTISWDLEAADDVYDASSKKLQNFDIFGTIVLPDGIDSNGLSLEVKISVIVMGIEGAEDDEDNGHNPPNRPNRPGRPDKDDEPIIVVPEVVAEPCDGGEDCVSHKFADVDPTQWYHEAVDFAVLAGLMNGVADDRFDVDGTTNRAMLVTILWCLEGSPIVEHNMKFKDVPEGEWYTEAIRWATSCGIVNGYGGLFSGKFGAMDGLTREQFAVILYNYANYKGYDVSAAENVIIQEYADSRKISKWALSAMEWAIGSGIMQGSNGNLNPADDASRAEAAMLLYRFAQENL